MPLCWEDGRGPVLSLLSEQLRWWLSRPMKCLAGEGDDLRVLEAFDLDAERGPSMSLGIEGHCPNVRYGLLGREPLPCAAVLLPPDREE